MKIIIELVITLFGAYLFSVIVSAKQRDRWTPYMFAFLFWWETSGALFCPSLKLFYPIKMFSWICMAFLFDFRQFHSMRRNSAMALFLAFWVYWTVAHFWGQNPFDALIVNWRCFRMILIGICTGVWAMRSDGGLERLYRCLTFSAMIVGLQYAAHGSWNVQDFESAGGRQVVDTYMLTHEEAAKFNVNGISTACSSVIAYPFLYAMGVWRVKWEIFVKIVAFLAMLILSLLLIKTGSRNGGLAFLALIWYMLWGKTNLKKSTKIIFVSCVAVLVAIGVAHFLGSSELRIFQFVNAEEMSFEEVGTGRGRIFIMWFEQMSPLQRVFGMGTPWYELQTNEQVIYNCHSIYFQIIITAGYVGCILFLLFVVAFCICTMKYGNYSSLAMILFLIWALTGVGESSNLISSSSGLAKYGLGIALALSCGLKMPHCYGNRVWENYCIVE